MIVKKLAPAAIVAVTALVLTLVTSGYAGDDSEVSSSPDATISLANFQAASVEIGQADFTHGFPNQDLPSPATDTIDRAFGDASVAPSGTLYLSDYDNQRVLGFASVPTANDESAAFVLGQPNLTSSGKGVGANQLGGPQTTAVFKNMLFVDDFYNSSVMIWKKAPTTNQAPANIILGQPGFSTRNCGCGANGLCAPETLSVAGGKLVVGDESNSRVMIWTKIPKKNGTAAKIVLGQPNFNSCGVENNDGTGKSGAPSQRTLADPSGVWTDGKRIVVLDGDNNRIMIWTKFPKMNFQPADIVLGQPDFASNTPNNNGSGGSGSPSAKNLDFPFDGVFSNGTQLFAVDQANNRILVWNTFPTTNFQPADVVLGQPNFSCGVASNDGSGCAGGAPSASNLDQPTGVYQFGTQLIVTDGSNSRYLIF